MSKSSLKLLEKEIEDAIICISVLQQEDHYAEMSKQFAKLLASLQQHQLITASLKLLVEPAQCLHETKILLESLQEAQQRQYRKKRLLTHRQILQLWLRKNINYQREFLPKLF
ncbi:transketolase [Solibacillus sp. R5-41]|uniref:transketolase n=1 Tax=Solibacillus sp. R5-41 TaxID=2048654 RepID=UPI000C126D5C|nr:transketolase [Solibacillus sp. R5-41]ATP39666.1 transketolase [Solibacillus sp. R5-41]